MHCQPQNACGLLLLACRFGKRDARWGLRDTAVKMSTLQEALQQPPKPYRPGLSGLDQAREAINCACLPGSHARFVPIR